MARVEGYEPLRSGGRRDKQERYVNTANGEVISKRQYERLRTGYRSLEERARVRAARGERNPMRRYNALLDAYERYRRTQGYKGSRGTLRTEAEIGNLNKILRPRPEEQIPRYRGMKAPPFWTIERGTIYDAKRTAALVTLGYVSEAWLLEAGYVRGAGKSPPSEYFTAA